MPYTKAVSSKRMIAKFFRDFRPKHSGWVGDAIEWIGEAIEYINAYYETEETFKCVEVKDHKAAIPCGIVELQGIEYECCRLPLNTATNARNHCTCSNLTGLSVHPTETYSNNPRWIHTSFAEGEITIYFTRVPIDDEGYPLVPDNIKYSLAIEFYILSRMILRGYKHPEFNYSRAIAEFEKYVPRARNSVKMPNIDRYENFKRSWLNIGFDIDNAAKGFDANYPYTTDADEPGTLAVTDLTAQSSDE